MDVKKFFVTLGAILGVIGAFILGLLLGARSTNRLPKATGSEAASKAVNDTSGRIESDLAKLESSSAGVGKAIDTSAKRIGESQKLASGIVDNLDDAQKQLSDIDDTIQKLDSLLSDGDSKK